ncbi:MAG: CHAD domain-containing protein [Cyanobacteriota bacterium]|nr:CHAD domain-containing protein [Cyanobacteriota bacterium]
MAPALHESASPRGTGGDAALSSGEFALELIRRQTRRLGNLQADVLADRDPEPLHQLRVSLRRLRTAMGQFAPALEFPDGVSVRRIAAVARRTGLCRDLDVLHGRLRDELLPRVPDGEQASLEGAMKRLRQDRAQAFTTLHEALHSSRYLKVLARLHKWQHHPRFTALGRLPLMPWLPDWQAPFTAGLFLDPGWLEADSSAETLHALRKRIKQARYSLEHFDRWCEPSLKAWIQDLRAAQDHLGDLHDLQILHRNFIRGDSLKKSLKLPVLQAELEAQQQLCWIRWRELAERLSEESYRRGVQGLLQQLGQGG